MGEYKTAPVHCVMPGVCNGCGEGYSNCASFSPLSLLWYTLMTDKQSGFMTFVSGWDSLVRWSSVADVLNFSRIWPVDGWAFGNLLGSSVGNIKTTQDVIDFPTHLKRNSGAQSLKLLQAQTPATRISEFQASHQEFLLHVLQVFSAKVSGNICRIHCPGSWLTTGSYYKRQLL